MFTTVKNIHFTKLVKAESGVKEFNFRKIPLAPVPTFHVDVTDECTNRIIFTMQKLEGGLWTMSPVNLPQWIINIQHSLQEIIEDKNSRV
ncbi:MAG TPA: hypothetical protein VFN30_08785 [Chitinophagaceae bacterium]|nr:hypothetical protein [Chitinophagaceae bacterium]